MHTNHYTHMHIHIYIFGRIIRPVLQSYNLRSLNLLPIPRRISTFTTLEVEEVPREALDLWVREGREIRWVPLLSFVFQPIRSNHHNPWLWLVMLMGRDAVDRPIVVVADWQWSAVGSQAEERRGREI